MFGVQKDATVYVGCETHRLGVHVVWPNCRFPTAASEISHLSASILPVAVGGYQKAVLATCTCLIVLFHVGTLAPDQEDDSRVRGSLLLSVAPRFARRNKFSVKLLRYNAGAV